MVVPILYWCAAYQARRSVGGFTLCGVNDTGEACLRGFVVTGEACACRCRPQLMKRSSPISCHRYSLFYLVRSSSFHVGAFGKSWAKIIPFSVISETLDQRAWWKFGGKKSVELSVHCQLDKYFKIKYENIFAWECIQWCICLYILYVYCR
jgi:hypothetical protein